jgi:hypothetical protein
MMSSDKPKLYKPFKNNTNSKNKYFVYVKSDNKKGYKRIGFGLKGYDDWRSGTATKEQRKSYRARASGIKNKQGQLTYKLKDTKNYWSYNYLW